MPRALRQTLPHVPGRKTRRGAARGMGRWLRVLTLAWAGLLAAPAPAVLAEKAVSGPTPSPIPDLNIAVLSYTGNEIPLGVWAPMVAHLNHALSPIRFHVVPLDHKGIDQAAAAADVDFVITNPGHYVELESEIGASRILTLDRGRVSPSHAVGSAVVALAGHEIFGNGLSDLRGLRVAVADRDSFNYQTLWRELAAEGIDPDRDLQEVKVVGFPMDNVFAAVASGQADVGIVPTCVVESRPDLGKRFRVLWPRPDPSFPCAASTRLYPDWPMATLRHTSPQIAKAVAIRLLDMPRSDAGVAWSVPADYQSVHDLFRELRIGPYAYLREPHLMQLVERYWQWLAALVVLLGLWIVYTVRVEYQVHARTTELREALAHREALEARMRANQEQADHLGRLSVLGELSGTLAHEMNQPLAAIGNYAQSLVRRADNGRLTEPAMREAAGEIAAEAHRAAAIVARIRGFAHKRAAQREDVVAADLVSEAVALFEAMLATAPPVMVIDELAPGRTIEADGVQIQQVVVNLLKNGYDATRGLPRERQRLEVRLAPGESGIRIMVRDFGPGLDVEAQARLFEPFFTTKTDGLGLGLAICKTIAEAHGGRLDASPATDGPGMVFVLSLPDAD